MADDTGALNKSDLAGVTVDAAVRPTPADANSAISKD